MRAREYWPSSFETGWSPKAHRRSSQAINPRKVRLLPTTSLDALRNRVGHHRGRLPLRSDPVLLRERDEAHEERLAVGSIPGTAR